MFHTSKSKYFLLFKKKTHVSKEKKRKNGGNMLIKPILVYKKVKKHTVLATLFFTSLSYPIVR